MISLICYLNCCDELLAKGFETMFVWVDCLYCENEEKCYLRENIQGNLTAGNFLKSVLCKTIEIRHEVTQNPE